MMNDNSGDKPPEMLPCSRMLAPVRIPLVLSHKPAWCPERRAEPITMGIPLPKGLVADPARIAVYGPAGRDLVQARVLDRWPDKSIRWALIDMRADLLGGALPDYFVQIEPTPISPATSDFRVEAAPGSVEVITSRAHFAWRRSDAFPFGLAIHLADGRRIDPAIDQVNIRVSGPLRAEVELRSGTISGTPLDINARIEVFADTATVRLNITVRNRRRAMHPGGQWPLGDPGSIGIRSIKLMLPVEKKAQVRCALEPNQTLLPRGMPFEIHQESSGGNYWDFATHRNRDGNVRLQFKGYRVREDGREAFGTRANPILTVQSETATRIVAIPQFWQKFPQAISVDESGIGVSLLAESADEHELQGGEQKTFRAVVALAPDTVSDVPLAWVCDPMRIYPSPDWCCAAGVIPFVVPESSDKNRAYVSLIRRALDGADAFEAKRERADEYGWRDFGDLPADHESAFQPKDQPLVSHYNNQYDAMAAFAMHFLRSGDERWWTLMDDLARHTRDIDIYHTTEDKFAYNGGLFWHTNHYTDAATSTHRTYPRGGSAGGGPASEHNYNAGLMLHYFLTGDVQSRDAAIGLGQWVLEMDDGRRTPFRWLARGATGLASFSGSMDYHGPGRGAANSILACLVAYRLTGEEKFRSKVDELIRRCVHPSQDPASLNLLDVERRWFYTVFLQALGTYLTFKRERDEYDAMYTYARDTLLRYARWMAAHERPYLDRPEILEFPNDTWAAQDARKAEVFRWAALYAAPEECDVFASRAEYFLRYSVETLEKSPSPLYTRPIVLMLANGVRDTGLAAAPAALSQERAQPAGFPISPFKPQKRVAIQRLRWIGVAIAILGAAITLAVVFR
jgi:hypothetical protein